MKIFSSIIFKIINYFKTRKKPLRTADELFSNGKIFEASDLELNNILKELTSNHVDQDNKIIRAVTVLTVKNNKSNSLIQFLLIVLTIFSLYLAWKQTSYTEVSTRSARIDQNIKMNDAIQRCKINATSADSGIYFIDSGKPASCQDILKYNH